MAETSSSAAPTLVAGTKNPKQMQQIIEGLNQMRTEQRALSGKLVEMEADMNEHRLVLDALKAVDSERKCFRMVGGVLIEQKVKDVAPSLEQNLELLHKTIENYQAKMQEKATTINDYVKTHNLASLLRSQNVGPAVEVDPKSGDSGKDNKPGATSSILV